MDDVEVKLSPARVTQVAAEDDSFPVGVEKRSETGSAVASNLALLAAVGVHNEQLQSRGPHQSLAQQSPVVFDFFGIGGMMGPVDDLFPVGGKKAASIIPHLLGQPLCVLAIGFHRVEFQVPVAEGGKDDLLSVAGDGGL